MFTKFAYSRCPGLSPLRNEIFSNRMQVSIYRMLASSGEMDHHNLPNLRDSRGLGSECSCFGFGMNRKKAGDYFLVTLRKSIQHRVVKFREKSVSIIYRGYCFL